VEYFSLSYRTGDHGHLKVAMTTRCNKLEVVTFNTSFPEITILTPQDHDTNNFVGYRWPQSASSHHGNQV